MSRFTQISMGSASEFEYLLLLTNDLEYITEDIYTVMNEKIIEIKKMLTSLIKKLNADR